MSYSVLTPCSCCSLSYKPPTKWNELSPPKGCWHACCKLFWQFKWQVKGAFRERENKCVRDENLQIWQLPELNFLKRWVTTKLSGFFFFFHFFLFYLTSTLHVSECLIPFRGRIYLIHLRNYTRIHFGKGNFFGKADDNNSSNIC